MENVPKAAYDELSAKSKDLKAKLASTEAQLASSQVSAAERSKEVSALRAGLEEYRSRNDAMQSKFAAEQDAFRLEVSRHQAQDRAHREAEKTFSLKEAELRNKLEVALMKYSEQEERIHSERSSLRNSLAEKEAEISRVRAEFMKDREILSREMKKREIDLLEKEQHYISELDRLSKEGQKRLEENTSRFVTKILGNLEDKAKRLSRISFSSAALGAGVLVVGLSFLIYLSITSAATLSSGVSWSQLVFYAAKGAMIAGVIGVISRYAYVFSKVYLGESLRIDDRIHAIKFGQLYVETYGASAEWDKVKEAFSNWHGSIGEEKKPEGESSETSQDFDRSDLKLATELIRAVTEAKS